jgi:hypothetical protein
MTSFKMKQKLPSEEMICRKFWRSVESMIAKGIIERGDIFCISNNQRGGKKQSQFRQHLDKLLGVTAGVADYCVLGIGFMEAKRVIRHNKNGTVGTTKPTDEQEIFAARCLAKGQRYEVFYTAEQGIDILVRWLELDKRFTPATSYLKTVSPTELLKAPI